MFLFSKRNRIIKKAVAKTVAAFADRTPKIYQHFFYGAFDIAPQHLVVWYLFESDTEMETAKSSGYCDELKKATIRNLINLGYPQEAIGTHNISFTTKEDIDNKANGDYHLYFQ
jgi:hypothetical protein